MAVNLIIFAVIIRVVMVRYKKRDGRKISEHWQWLVDTLGLGVCGGEPMYPNSKWLSWIRKPIRLEGTYRGCFTKIYNYTVGSGKNSTTYSTVRIVGPNPKELTFNIYREGMFSKLGKIMGMQDIQTGDPTFDDKFVIKSNNPEFIKIALLPEIKSKFIDIWERHKPHGSITLKDEELHYDEVGTIRTVEIRERFGAIADLLADLRGTIEFYNQKG